MYEYGSLIRSNPLRNHPGSATGMLFHPYTIPYNVSWTLILSSQVSQTHMSLSVVSQGWIQRGFVGEGLRQTPFGSRKNLGKFDKFAIPCLP